jgi:hypothetical protein
MVWMVVSLALTTGAQARTNNSSASSDGPYRAIVDRNVFDLRPQPVAPPVTAPATPPPNVKLIGVMLISGHPQGVFSVLDAGPGKQPVSYILSADQRQGTLEVKSINMTAKPPSSRVQIGEDIVELKLEDGPKGPAAPGPAPGPGQPAPGQRPFPAGGRAGGRPGFPMPAPGGSFTPPGGYNPTPSASYSPGVSPDGGTGVLPTRPVRTDTTDQNPPMTAEQQIVAIEQARDQYSQNNDPRLPILPPTQLTPALQAQFMSGAGMPTGNTGGGAPPMPGGGPPSLPMGARATGSLNQ